jgi:AraC-like DNA-binding protein
VQYDRHDAPSYSIILSGQCLLYAENRSPLLLERGDFLLWRDTPAFTLSSELDAPCVVGTVPEIGVRYGDQEGDPELQMLGGTFGIDPNNSDLLLNLLPELVHIRSAESDTSNFASIINVMMKECIDHKPGGDSILERLMEVTLIEALRWQHGPGQPAQSGLFAGLQHPSIALTIRAMHSSVNFNWTVATLAKKAGMSRSAYAKHFGEIVGCGPMEYLTRWRMSLAQDALIRRSAPLEAIAHQVGYRSAAAFSNAFRRVTGNSPSAFGRSTRNSH